VKREIDRIKKQKEREKRTLIEESWIKSRRTYLRELCQRFVSNLPLWKANRRIEDAETSVNFDAFNMGFIIFSM
jgi:hypothetical protein